MLVSGKKVEDAIRSLVNARSLQLQCSRLLHEGLLMTVPLYGCKAMMWEEKERCADRQPQRSVWF